MYIVDIAFSFDWFLTVPGMLISGGVLLLIIALILMISSSKGKKKEKVEANQNAEVATDTQVGEVPVVNNMEVGEVVTEQPVVNPVMDSSVVMDAPLGPIEAPINMDSVIPEVAPVAPTVDSMTTIEPVVPLEAVAVVEPSVPATSETPEVVPVEMPVMEPVAPVAPVTPVEVQPEVAPIPVVEPVIPTETITEEISLETPDATNLDKTSVNIYGGNPIPTIEPVVEAPRPIYGGADPLEATQKLPKVEVHHEPYSARIESAPVEMPAMEPVAPVAPVAPVEVQPEVAPIPVVEPVTIVEPSIPVAPEVPVIEPIVSEVTPVDAPIQSTQSEVVRIPDVEQL